ncbi:GroES-like protein [Ophiobolus disseminans]|uniref:GroES-like protein n=1 Tax=Ophiobolus disseminans TaxID=1469910 RepID=A0A6A6ZVS3_9PLEO|nr:GroES-like protein [Ophiobolus disseminans]
MPTMKALTIASPGATPQIASDIPIPMPGPGQILVKTSYVAINPVDTTMSTYGAMVQSWPFTPGCDAAGTIVALGPDALSAWGTAWVEGERVFGCTRLGAQGYAAWAEYFLFDAALCFHVPSNFDMAQAASTGVGLLTASLGAFAGLGVDILDAEDMPEKDARGEWALVFGGAGSVGQFAMQVLSVAGFSVVATSSSKSFELLESLGAVETIDYKLPASDIVERVRSITNGKLNYAFDAVSVNDELLSSTFAALAPMTEGVRRFTTTNDWDPHPEVADTLVKPIQLGPIGQPDAVELNDNLKAMIPIMYKLLEKGVIKPSEYAVEGESIEDILKAWEVQKSGARGGRKVVVKIIEE